MLDDESPMCTHIWLRVLVVVVLVVVGPSGVLALPLAAGINEGGHYFDIGPSGAVQTVSDSRRPLF